jgi:hypothetical protein
MGTGLVPNLPLLNYLVGQSPSFKAFPCSPFSIDDIGGFPKGTVLGSGNSWSNTSTIIDLYASSDKGRHWKFVSNIAKGGRPNTTNGADPIWEPFIL